MTTPARVEPARADDLDGVLAVLTRHGLPLDGLREHLDTTLVVRQEGRVVGSAALELYRDGALLRSVAVAPELQGQGWGRTLADAAIQLARDRQAPAIYLLTTTAERYFPKLGFDRITRAEVPASVQQSIEFTSACPSSAIVMRKRL